MKHSSENTLKNVIPEFKESRISKAETKKKKTFDDIKNFAKKIAVLQH